MFHMDHVGITAADFEKTLHFYQALGFQVFKHWTNPERGMEACMMRSPDGSCLEIFHFDDAIPAADTVGRHYQRDGEAIEADLPQIGIKHIAFRVSDLDQAVEALRRQGLCEAVDVMHGGLDNRYLFIRDPNGIFVEIMENPYIQDET